MWELLQHSTSRQHTQWKWMTDSISQPGQHQSSGISKSAYLWYIFDISWKISTATPVEIRHLFLAIVSTVTKSCASHEHLRQEDYCRLAMAWSRRFRTIVLSCTSRHSLAWKRPRQYDQQKKASNDSVYTHYMLLRHLQNLWVPLNSPWTQKNLTCRKTCRKEMLSHQKPSNLRRHWRI